MVLRDRLTGRRAAQMFKPPFPTPKYKRPISPTGSNSAHALRPAIIRSRTRATRIRLVRDCSLVQELPPAPRGFSESSVPMPDVVDWTRLLVSCTVRSYRPPQPQQCLA